MKDTTPSEGIMPKSTTILERFKSLISRNDSTKAIIGFLAMESYDLIEFIDAIDEEEGCFPYEKTQEVFDFCDFFYEHYDEQTQQARFSVWPETDAPILTIRDTLFELKLSAEREIMLNSIPENILSQASILADAIMSIRKNKSVLLRCGTESIDFNIPKTIPKECLDDVKADVTIACAYYIMDEQQQLKVLAENKDGTIDVFEAKKNAAGQFELVLTKAMGN